jgi:hypothetical protein
MEQQLGTRPTERQVTQLVADQQVGPVQLAQQVVQPVLLLGLFQLRHQPRGGEEPHPFALPTRGQAEGGGEVRFNSTITVLL